jgi:hypothetical protein
MTHHTKTIDTPKTCGDNSNHDDSNHDNGNRDDGNRDDSNHDDDDGDCFYDDLSQLFVNIL